MSPRRGIAGLLCILLLVVLFTLRHELLGWAGGWLSAVFACTIIAAVYIEKTRP